MGTNCASNLFDITWVLIDLFLLTRVFSPAVRPRPPQSIPLAATHIPGVDLHVSNTDRGPILVFGERWCCCCLFAPCSIKLLIPRHTSTIIYVNFLASLRLSQIFSFQLRKVNVLTLAEWLKRRGVAVKSKEKKADLQSKVMQFLKLVPLHEQWTQQRTQKLH